MISEKMETKQKAFMISASWNSFDSVSYTHLTLPTTERV